MSHYKYEIYTAKYLFFCSLNCLCLAFFNIKFTLPATELQIKISKILISIWTKKRMWISNLQCLFVFVCGSLYVCGYVYNLQALQETYLERNAFPPTVLLSPSITRISEE
jgi:hypothetical protein